MKVLCWARYADVPLASGGNARVAVDGVPSADTPPTLRLELDCHDGGADLTPDEAIRLARSLERAALTVMVRK